MIRIHAAAISDTPKEAAALAIQKPNPRHLLKDPYILEFLDLPDLPLDQEWTDAKLYKRYALSKEEIAFIEFQGAAHDDALFDEAIPDEAENE